MPGFLPPSRNSYPVWHLLEHLVQFLMGLLVFPRKQHFSHWWLDGFGGFDTGRFCWPGSRCVRTAHTNQIPFSIKISGWWPVAQQRVERRTVNPFCPAPCADFKLGLDWVSFGARFALADGLAVDIGVSTSRHRWLVADLQANKEEVRLSQL